MNDGDLVGIVAGLSVMVVCIGVLVGRAMYGKRDRYGMWSQYWQDALRALDPNVRMTASSTELRAEFSVDGMPFKVEFKEQVQVMACVPQGLTVTLPPGGKIPGVAQRVEWAKDTLVVRVGLEKSASLATICRALAPVVREAIAANAAKVDGRPIL